MGVLISHKIKHLIFSILLHQHLVVMNSEGCKPRMWKHPCLNLSPFSVTSWLLALGKKENKREGVGTKNCILAFFISFYIICRIKNLLWLRWNCQLSSISQNLFSITVSNYLPLPDLKPKCWDFSSVHGTDQFPTTNWNSRKIIFFYYLCSNQIQEFLSWWLQQCHLYLQSLLYMFI